MLCKKIIQTYIYCKPHTLYKLFKIIHGDLNNFIIVILLNLHLFICRDNIEPSVCNLTNHKFVLNTFNKPTICYHCSKYLKGCIFQVI